MDSKVITVRFNEFDQEYLELAKQILVEDKDFYNVDNSLVIKMAIRMYISNKIYSNEDIEKKYSKLWSDIVTRNRNYLLYNSKYS